MKNLKLTVTPESAGARLDSFAASDESGLSRSAAARSHHDHALFVSILYRFHKNCRWYSFTKTHINDIYTFFKATAGLGTDTQSTTGVANVVTAEFSRF